VRAGTIALAALVGLARCATPPTRAVPVAAPACVEADDGEAVTRGERPWWSTLAPGPWVLEGRSLVLARGSSAEHHHPAEGWLRARVAARLAVRAEARAQAVAGALPEPEVLDFFVTPDGRFLALAAIPVPGAASAPEARAPAAIRGPGRRRVGRHLFEDGRHLFLECEVEGSLANPERGRARISAEHAPAPPKSLGSAARLAQAGASPR
jgi:hypothetical protein